MPNLIPPPLAGGCPPVVQTATATFGGETIRQFPPDGLPLAQVTALVRGDYEGCR